MRRIETIKEIVQRLQLILVDVEEDYGYVRSSGMDYNHFHNRSFNVGGDEIVLGFYDNPEFKLASFFHELGHRYVTDDFKKLHAYESDTIEREAWRIGYIIAETHGIFFGDETRAWAEKQADSYTVVGYQCMLCGRDKFTRKSPHRCGSNYRKRKIVWREITKSERDGREETNS